MQHGRMCWGAFDINGQKKTKLNSLFLRTVFYFCFANDMIYYAIKTLSLKQAQLRGHFNCRRKKHKLLFIFEKNVFKKKEKSNDENYINL